MLNNLVVLCFAVFQKVAPLMFYQRYDPLLVFFLSAHHGVAFARASLAVRKDAHVVAFEGMKQHLLADVFVHLHLRRIVDVLGLQTVCMCVCYK